MTAPDPYAITTLHGRPIDNATATAVRKAEGIIGREFTVYQGIGDADASGGTHRRGRVVDLDVEDPGAELGVLKRVGFAIYRRRYRPGVWAEHYHGCLMFGSTLNPQGIDPSAYAQIVEFLKGGDGLVGDYDDPDPWRPQPPAVFTVEEYREAWERQHRTPKTNVQKARTRIRQALGDLSTAIARLDDVDPDRVVARNQLEELRKERRQLRAILDKLPER